MGSPHRPEASCCLDLPKLIIEHWETVHLPWPQCGGSISHIRLSFLYTSDNKAQSTSSVAFDLETRGLEKDPNLALPGQQTLLG